MDWPLVISVALLLLVGLLALWSASAVQKNHADFRAQVTGILFALPFFLVFLMVDPRIWGYYSRAVYASMLALLLLVKVPGVGRTGGGAERWINLGPVALQPSEIAKLLVILTLADYMARQGSKLRTVRGFLLSFLHVLPPFLLVAAQPNLSTSLVFLAIWVGASIVANQKLKYLLYIAATFAAIATVAWNSSLIKDYQKERVLAWFQGGQSYHTQHAVITIGSAQLIGAGILQGPLKEAKFVPEATTDFIFTVIAEEGGFIGSILVLCLYAFFLYRVWLVVFSANVPLFKYIAAGIFVVFSFHTLVNLLVVVGVIPVTGVPLPFMSFGRSAMLLSFAAVGLLLNIRGREKQLVF